MMSGVETTGATQGCLHEYVEGALKDVVRILQANQALLAVPATPGEFGPEESRPGFVHRGLASLPVQIGGLDASLVAMRVVGGTQAPITELVLVGAATSSSEPPAALARGFADLVRALEKDLRVAAQDAAAARPETSAA